jgi:hypothetical protein
MKKKTEQLNLLHNNNCIIRVPFLIKGELVAPLEIRREQIETAFLSLDRDATYVKLPGVQVIREPVIDRRTMKSTGEYIYQVMPVIDGSQLIETDIDKLVQSIYAISVDDILDYLDSILSTLYGNKSLTLRLLEMCRLTSEFPDTFLDSWFASLPSAFNREAARQMIDTELSFQGMPGSDYLDGWVELPYEVSQGWLNQRARSLFTSNMSPARKSAKSYVRAMPTRQLHITAGNAPEVPLISALRAILTKSAAVIKLPYGATLPGALFSVAAATAAPDHPITQNLSMVYWQGGDESIENVLFMPEAFDRIVVWGSPETVTSVQSRALFTRTVYLNPRYGISLIGKEVFPDKIEEVAQKASIDVMIYNQKACTSSLVHYIEGSDDKADKYARILCGVLEQWDRDMPNFISPSNIGKIKLMRRGKYINSKWNINKYDNDFSSGVVVIQDEFDILDHPMCRFVVVRPVPDLEEALKYVNRHVSTVGIYPEKRTLELKDRILARGVSSVFPLGQCENMYAGMPHDGMLVLNELVDWKNC